MKPWLLVLAIVLPGGLLLAAVVLLRQRWAVRAARHAETLIRPPVPKFEKPDARIRLVRKA